MSMLLRRRDIISLGGGGGIPRGLVAWYNCATSFPDETVLNHGDIVPDLSGNGYDMVVESTYTPATMPLTTRTIGKCFQFGYAWGPTRYRILKCSSIPSLSDFTLLINREYTSTGDRQNAVAWMGTSTYKAGVFWFEGNQSGSIFNVASLAGNKTNNPVWFGTQVTRKAPSGGKLYFTPTSYDGTAVSSDNYPISGNCMLRLGGLGSLRNDAPSMATLYIASFLLFNRTLKQGEIDWVKENMM